MHQKCLIFGDAESAKAILITDDPQTQQAIGRKAKGFVGEVWAGMRQLVAMRGLLAKFSQNEDLKKKLLDTGSAYLVECAHGDNVWACGVGLDQDARFDTAQWRGQNILGFALMTVRGILRDSEG